MRFDIVTLFPEMFAALDSGITGRALKRELVSLQYWNPRDYTSDVHRSVDDRPYGGGPGMVMSYQPLADAVDGAKKTQPTAPVIYLSPQGQKLDQRKLCQMAGQDGFILVAGRYEGVDERFITEYVDEECSLGDYVLSGGELPAMVLIDAITRLQPGALGDADSAQQDSHMDGLLDCPHYTRPELVNNQRVPEVLLGGHHADIRSWRKMQSLGRTHERRPDLLAERQLTDEEQILIKQYLQNREGSV